MRDLDERLSRHAKVVWGRLPVRDRQALLDRGCQMKMVDAHELPPGRWADAGADGLIRIRRDVPEHLAQRVIAHECAHVRFDHCKLVGHYTHAELERAANAWARAWGGAPA